MARTFPDQKNLQKQMGCMAGFLHLFDRHHILAGKRIYSAKRLPSPPEVADTASESGQSTRSPEPQAEATSPQLEICPIKTPPPPKEGTTTRATSWKFREAPRLSLDSRATTDANGSLHRKQIRTTNPSQSPGPGGSDDIEKQRNSTSVIARLMGLEPLPTSITESPSPHLQRSASESRVTRDLNLTHTSHESTFDYQHKPTPTQNLTSRPKQAKCEAVRPHYRKNHCQQQQRNYYDSTDFFPEPTPNTVTVCGEIEKRLKMSGIDGSSKDLETLKHILEALQLKGLLHSNKSSSIDQNFVYERVNEPPVVLMKPCSSPESPPPSYRPRQGLIPRRNFNETLPLASPNRRMRNSVSPTRSESSTSSSPQGRKQRLNVETHRNRNASSDPRRVSSPVSSPKPSSRRPVDSQTSSSPRNRRSVESSSSIGSDEHSKGKSKSLLSRCDMLLQSIANMNSTNLTEQPSPVSVLDPSFYKEDESSPPSPVPKRSIDFKDLPVDFYDEDSSWTSSAISTVDGSVSDDSDYIYVADVLRALVCLPEESNVFTLLEKQQCKRGKDGSYTSKLKRKLIFDSVSEILNKNKQLPPWKVDLCTDSTSLPFVWPQFKKIRERDDESHQELFQVICGVLKKDLAVNSFNAEIEVAESVLVIERMVFKDLIGEAICDLASSTVSSFYPRRKLAF